METIIVLNDGETWTLANGCKMMAVTDEHLELLNEGYKPSDLTDVDVIIVFKDISGL